LNQFSNDLAVMITDSFQFDQFVQPACLPPSIEFDIIKGFGLISGYGVTDRGITASIYTLHL